jgi:hypothetical protein
MTQQHPIIPPPELVEKWSNLPLIKQEIIAIAWRNGADTELEACIKELYLLWDKDHIVTLDDVVKHLRAARRAKPPTLKEQALKDVDEILKNPGSPVHSDFDRIISALKSIPDPS